MECVHWLTNKYSRAVHHRFVCATSKQTKGIKRFRSYQLAGELDLGNPTIVDAARATSAATSFFESVTIGAREYADGALVANNPVNEVESEASNLWCPQTGNLKSLVKCFISVGTGKPAKKGFDDAPRAIVQALKDLTTETENTAREFIDRWRQHYDENRYFRFNVDQGLQNVGLAEYRDRATIEAATEEYFNQLETKSKVRSCVQNLEGKICMFDPT